MPGVYNSFFNSVMYLHINMDPSSEVSVGFRLDALHQSGYTHFSKRHWILKTCLH